MLDKHWEDINLESFVEFAFTLYDAKLVMKFNEYLFCIYSFNYFQFIIFQTG